MADGKRGYVNRFIGELILPAQKDRAWMFSEGLGGVLKDNKLGFINIKGETVIPFQFPYDPVFEPKVDFLFKNGFCTATNSKGMHGLINKQGKWVLSPEYDYITNPVKGYRVVKRGDLYGVIDSMFNWTMPITYEWVKVTTTGFVVIQNDVQKLLAFDTRTVLQPAIYDQTNELHYNSHKVTKKGEDILVCSDYTAFCINEKWGVMDKKGKVVIKAQYSEITMLTDNLFSCQKGDYLIIVNVNGEVVHD
jgi:hypothetical protein